MTTTQHTTQRMTQLVMNVSTNELISNVLGSAWETWYWWTELEYAEGCDWDILPATDTEPFVRVEANDPDDDSITVGKWLTVEDIVKSAGDILATHQHFNWEDLDASGGDCIMQHAIYGEVVWG